MITHLTLFNWMCFRGLHSIRLGPKAYAITAQHEADRNRSNWSGKSALLEAIEFALFGKLNRDRRFDADGWITKGEKEGAVGIVLDGDIAIKRERIRGKSTQVRFSAPHTKGPATQDEADAKMIQHLRFEADDYKSVAYFAQGMMARLIRTEPEKRFDIIRGWLNLEQAEQAESRAQDIVIEKVRELQKLKAKLDALSQPAVEGDEDELGHDEMRTAQKSIKKKIDNLEIQRAQHGEKVRYEDVVERFGKIIEQGKNVAKEIEDYPSDLKERAEKLEEKLKERYATYMQASREAASKRIVASGKFDGVCPVANIQCPAKKEINADREASQSLYDRARAVEKEKKASYEALQSETNALLAQAKDLAKKQTLRDSLREQASEIRDDVIEAKKELKKLGDLADPEEIDSEYNRLYDQYHDLIGELGAIEERKKQKEQAADEQNNLRQQLDALAKEVATATQSRSILRATQRRVAERALNAIGYRANDMLLQAGADLKLQVQWEREGKNLAKNCDTCGMAFPSSAKVKTCESCGTERGLNIVQKLEFLLSDRSGAADDFAGIALQLSAGSWLLQARESPWATALLDEPLSQMDRANRRAAAKQLLNMVGTSAYRQLVVISHDEHSVEMFPNRINIVVGKNGRRQVEMIE